MGRRPNQLILEFFERGPKLEDSSNRYQHTCKSCGERFPKGRIDSLTNHLLKRCPALPLEKRQRIHLQLHHTVPGTSDLSRSANAPGVQDAGAQTLNLPFAPSKGGLSALETLAEVSRQHLDLSGKRVPLAQQTSSPSLAQQLSNAANAHSAFEFLVDDRPDEDHVALSHALDMPGGPALPPIYPFSGPLQHSPATSPRLDNAQLASSRSIMVPSLVMAASAANDLMPLANGNLHLDSDLGLTQTTSMPDKFFSNQGRQWPNTLDPLLRNHLSQKGAVANNGGSLSPSQPRPIAISPSTQTHFTTDFGLDAKPAKAKVRGRFNDSRRKEVQEVRKRGACIRCRMLKKPCSGDIPCSTCQSVESARLWKQPCIRTRLAEEFNLYAASLQGVLAFHAASQAKARTHFSPSTGRIEATLDSDTGVHATFKALRSHDQTGSSDMDPAIFTSHVGPQLELLDIEDDVGRKLETYYEAIEPALRNAQDSYFMTSTVELAYAMSSEVKDSLLGLVLELWNLTRMLTSPDSQWQLASNASEDPSLTPLQISPDDATLAGRKIISANDDVASYRLIELQLKGATEKRASCLARTIMNRLERRLLQRQQSTPFDSFLASVILVACVERMCWLFHTWDLHENVDLDMNYHSSDDSSHLADQQSPPKADSDMDIAQALQSLPHAQDSPLAFARHPKWPFDKPPSYYWHQGERFSDILLMLLKMRGVPPKTTERSEGGVLMACGDDEDEKVVKWYEAIGLTAELLVQRRDAEFLGKDPREWELKFAGKLILSSAVAGGT